jgi:mannose-1-phosphate guanylyltransferase
LNGDILTDFDISAVWRVHEEKGARATISLFEVEDPSAYGLVLCDEEGRVTEFLEKPKTKPAGGAFINAGAYVLERDVLDLIPSGRAVSFEREVFPGLIGEGLYACPVEGYWLDIGTPERYLEATRYLLERAATAPDLVLKGEECVVRAGAHLGPVAVLGDRCRVEEDAVLERAVLLEGAVVEREAVVRDSLVGRDARIGAGSRLEQETIVGQGASVPPGEVLTGARVEG